MNWRPIRTAPRDGRRVLVWIDDSKQTVAFAKLWFYEDGSLGGGAEGFNGHWNITHWMPLPDPPEYRAPSPELIAAIAADDSR